MIILTEDISAVMKYYPNIPEDIFMQLIALDPTYRSGSGSLGKYGKWILNLYKNGVITEEDFGEITPILNQFTTYRNRIDDKDLFHYKSLDELEEVLAAVVNDDSMLTDRQRLRFMKNVASGKIKSSAEDEYDINYEDDEWIVRIPYTHEAAIKLGEDTKWCTANGNPEWWEKYTCPDPDDPGELGYYLYIIENKHTGEKFQYCSNWEEDCPFMNANDHEVDIEQFMSECGKGLAEYLHMLNEEKFTVVTCVNGMYITETGELVDFDDNYERIRIPDSVVGIGEGAFKYTQHLIEVRIGDSLEYISGYAFDGSSVERVIFDDGAALEDISVAAFRNSDVERVYLPNNLPAIRPACFYCCPNLEHIYIGSDTEIIMFKAFEGCGSLETVDIDVTSDTPIEIQSDAFMDCFNLNTIHIRSAVKSIHPTAFNGCNELTIYSDSDYIREHIMEFENNRITLCSEDDGNIIYTPEDGFID